MDAKRSNWNTDLLNSHETCQMKTPIICPHCHEDSGYTQEELMFFVITHDLLCQHCGKVVIFANNGVTW